MNEKRSFTETEIMKALDELSIKYDLFGSSLNNELHFCSLRKPEPCGIYFIEGLVDIKSDISDSLFITSISMNKEGCLDLVVSNPQLTFYKLMDFFFNKRIHSVGIHPTAIVDTNAVIHPKSWVGPYCVLEGCVIDEGVRLHSHVVVMKGTHVAKNVTVESHSTLGATGVAWVWDDETGNRISQPQIGYTHIGEGTFLGTDITIVRGSVNETTSVGKYCVIAHGSKVGHGSLIGDECHFANNVSIAGNVALGQRCFLGAGVVIRPQTTLGEAIVVGAGSVVVKDCLEKNQLLVGVPAVKKNLIKTKLAGVPAVKKGKYNELHF
jgi:UDP-3-O-[3-hydroxymyristoyl] glucosamine N-acyltransferase